MEALSVVLDHSMPHPDQVEYRLVGTGAALLHGVRLPASDIDLLVRNREAIHHFARTLKGFPCIAPPAWLPAARQYYANYEVSGVEVGISTVEVDSSLDTFETYGPGPWKHFVQLPCGRHMINDEIVA